MSATDDLKVRAEALSDFATMYRYPGSEVEPLTQEIVDKAIDDANFFVSKAKEILMLSAPDGEGEDNQTVRRGSTPGIG